LKVGEEMYQETLWGEPEVIQVDEKKQISRRFADPRSDKAADHEYWQDLLWNCWHLERDLFYLLHGIRCGGGEITLTPNSLRLQQGEWTPLDWENIKNRLGPFKEKLVDIFKLTRMGRVSEEKLPEGLFGG